MASNGNIKTNGNGNGVSRSRWKDIGAESMAFSVAEGVSMGVSLGVVGIADQIAPGLLKAVDKAVAKICIAPFLDTIENTQRRWCKLEECQPDYTRPREERAERLAHIMVLFGAAWATSFVAKMMTRQKLNKMMGLKEEEVKKTGNWFMDNIVYKFATPHDWGVVLWDETIHYGSIIAMNTVGAKYTDGMIHGTSSMLQKTLGMSKGKANEISSMAVIWELPNFLGLMSGISKITHHHLSKDSASHVERLAQQTALSTTPTLKL